VFCVHEKALGVGPVDSGIRRSKFVFFYIDDAFSLDVQQLMAGRVGLVHVRQPFAVSALTGATEALTRTEWNALLEIPTSEWLPSAEVPIDSERLGHLVRRGILLSDVADVELDRVLRREENLSATEWNPFAALYHFMTQWDDVRVVESIEPTMADFLATYGDPPPAFHRRDDAVGTVELPLVSHAHPLYDILDRRRTCRTFDMDSPLAIEDLATVLYAAFGCHTWAPVHEDIIAVGKTSPSGGGLHPIEVYPLVLNVEGLDCGLYHYQVRGHQLEIIERMSRPEARRLADEFAAGQSFVSEAHVVLIMTARFYRNYWKYRRHPRAYAVVLMDAAHLSQTLYLVCTERRLGAFITAAINGRNIERRLKLDGIAEGAIALSGFGIPAVSDRTSEPRFIPYDPVRSLDEAP
jgi:putative peptide maturation dehydrogenase